MLLFFSEVVPNLRNLSAAQLLCQNMAANSCEAHSLGRSPRRRRGCFSASSKARRVVRLDVCVRDPGGKGLLGAPAVCRLGRVCCSICSFALAVGYYYSATLTNPKSWCSRCHRLCASTCAGTGGHGCTWPAVREPPPLINVHTHPSPLLETEAIVIGVQRLGKWPGKFR